MTEEKRRRRVLVPVGVAVSVSAVATALVWYFGRRERWDWGDVPTWVGAVATVVALGAAGVGAYFAYRQLSALRQQVQLQINALRIQADQFTADRAESEHRAIQEIALLNIQARRQAEQVDVIPTFTRAAMGSGTEYKVYSNVLALKVLNNSPRPIRRISCLAIMKPYSWAPYGRLEKGEQSSHPVTIGQEPLTPLRLMRRGSSMTFAFPVQRSQEPGKPARTYILWSRDSNGRLADDFLKGQEFVPPVTEYIIRFTDDADQHWELSDELRLTSIPDRNDW